MTVTHLSGFHGQWYGSDLVECMYTQQTAYRDLAHCTRPVLLIKAIKIMQCVSRTLNALWFTHFSHHHTKYALIKLDVLNQYLICLLTCTPLKSLLMKLLQANVFQMYFEVLNLWCAFPNRIHLLIFCRQNFKAEI